MFCENCGSKLPDGSKFCGGCGTRMEATKPVYKAPVQPEIPAQAYHPQNIPQNYTSQPPASYHTTLQMNTEPLSIGQFIVMFLLLSVPILNFVLLFMWGFGKSVNINKRNYARAIIIISAIMLIVWILIGGVIIATMGDIFGGYY